MAKILVVDDEHNMRELVADILIRDGHIIEAAASGEEALEILSGENFDLVVLDLRLPGIDGIETMKRLRSGTGESTPDVIIITAHGTLDAAVEAIRSGAVDFLIKPFEPDALRSAVSRAKSELLAFNRVSKVESVLVRSNAPILENSAESGQSVNLGLVGTSNELRELLRSIQKVGGTDATVLITGETGTGKELVARGLHLSSLRRDGPFLSINCAALPDTLVENELFGHERGAYTDARTRQAGKVAQAEGGTLFLDEVGDLAPAAQAKLLRLIEEHEYIPLGGSNTVKADVRIVAATHRDLSEMVSGGVFREDLYWRLRVIPIHIPPLRERGSSDIVELAQHFLDEFALKYGRTGRGFSPEQKRVMIEYSWPGNARELRNFVERHYLLGEDTILSSKKPPHAKDFNSKTTVAYKVFNNNEAHEKPLHSVKRRVLELERKAIVDALNKSGGNKKMAARELGMSYRTLFNKIKKLNISTEILAR